jgi:IMP dehydrogenase
MCKVLAGEVMISKIQTIGPEEKVALARLKMLRYGVGALPVVKNDNTLIGMLTLRDINFAGMDVGNLTVMDLMTKDNLITVSETTKLLKIADMMLATGIQRIPVVNHENKLVGLITQSVLIRSFRNLFG